MKEFKNLLRICLLFLFKTSEKTILKKSRNGKKNEKYNKKSFKKNKIKEIVGEISK